MITNNTVKYVTIELLKNRGFEDIAESKTPIIYQRKKLKNIVKKF